MEKNNPETNQMPEVVDTTNLEIVPIETEKALAKMSDEDKEKVLALADKIDVLKLENIMNYGSSALVRTFDQCGTFLKNERGSEADQRVIKQVIELSKRASKSYEDFNLVLKDPNFFQKLLLRISSKQRKSRSDRIQQSAVTNYKLLIELKKSCDEWIDMLVKAMGDISNSFGTDLDELVDLEKYIVAGNIARKRIGQELEEKRQLCLESGLIQDEQDYNEYKEGTEVFDIVLNNLEKSRAMYKLSLAQLAVVQKSNRNVQITIRTQKHNSMTLMGQQLRNAVLNAKNQEVIEGQQAITRLNDELLKEVSQTIGLTAIESEKGKYAGFYSIEAARQAVLTVIKTCEDIQRTAEEMLPKMKSETQELNKMMEDLEPNVNKVRSSKMVEDATSGEETKPKRRKSGSTSKLDF